ncbi:ankyrin repeat domain-containing protein [Fretibacterium fastidiosum]|uniref:ankyrin repeat domain-containing protein n=1 Tax=Fretibacterium fastidiosum TaxID=651822 RepID=UPI0002E71F30|nr:ankyrin repeat domain-containing protein [Fretibacterium fastidiosum]
MVRRFVARFFGGALAAFLLLSPACGAELAELCALGDVQAVRGALEAGERAAGRDERGRSPLYCTVAAGVRVPLSTHVEVARLLLLHGAEADAADEEGRTPLALSLEKGSAFAGLTELLLDFGADPNGPAGGGTPLHLAAEHGSARQVELLLERGANPLAKDGEGRSPLTSALLAEDGGLEKARLLLDAGADVNARCPLWGEEGVTPLMAAAALAPPELVALLLDRGALRGAQERVGPAGPGVRPSGGSGGERPAPALRRLVPLRLRRQPSPGVGHGAQGAGVRVGHEGDGSRNGADVPPLRVVDGDGAGVPAL